MMLFQIGTHIFFNVEKSGISKDAFILPLGYLYLYTGNQNPALLKVAGGFEKHRAVIFPTMQILLGLL